MVMAAKPSTIDKYLAGVSAEQRVALKKLRKAILAVAPQAEECISYGVPAFRLNGRFLVAFGPSGGHCSFYPGSTAIEVHQRELRKYDISKGTIRFQNERPLPAALVRKLVKARLGEFPTPRIEKKK
jgi:uncharacterized protein YdhG (YjbR/CyaY superfamily)